MASPDFWNNQEKAQETIDKLQSINRTITPLEELNEKLSDIEALYELAEEDEPDAEVEFEREAESMFESLEKFELLCMLSGKDDQRNAFLSIHAGAGGTEACDWTDMLLRMYMRWAENSGYKYEIVEYVPGDEAGARSVTLHIKGKYAYGYLKSEIGVHRLVRISPFDANKRRHTSFAGVDVLPEIDEKIEVDINPADLKIDTYKAGGPGGQHVNKTSSAVRITHLPTGAVVQCQQDRSQLKNRKTAMNMLRAKLYQMEEMKRKAEIEKSYDEKGSIEWGNQIRSYVLQPYTMVKDLRTDEETGNVDAVLDGEIDRFIEAYLKQQIKTG